MIRVRIDTACGAVVVAVDDAAAPLSSAAFLSYVDQGLLAGTTIYRIVTAQNQPESTTHPIEVIQWGRTFDEISPLAPIAHEGTDQTGLSHRRGTLSMARRAIGTAGHAYVFCMGGDLASLDEHGGRNPDGHGFAAFGEVIGGWDVLAAIFARAETIERIAHRIAILSAARI